MVILMILFDFSNVFKEEATNKYLCVEVPKEIENVEERFQSKQN